LSQENALVPAEMFKSPEFLEKALQFLRQDRVIARLGDGEVFFLTEGNKTRRAIKAKVELEYPTHLYFPGGAGKKPGITAEGFDKINRYAGVDIIRPRTVMAQDGTERGNPYFERDQATGALVSMYIRGLGIGYSPTGAPVCIDRTLFINLPTLLIQEVQAKLKKNPALGMMGTRHEKPSEVVFYKDNGQWGSKKKFDPTPTKVVTQGCWHFIPMTGDLGYWVEISHPLIQEIFDSFSQKQRYLDRTASTVLSRVILAAHPAIATKSPVITQLTMMENDKYKIQSAKGYVIVFGFDNHNSRDKADDLRAMAERLAEGEDAANMNIVMDRSDAVDGTSEPEIGDVEPEPGDPTATVEGPEDVIPEPVEEVPPAPPQEEPPAPPPTAKFLFFTCPDCKGIMTLAEKPKACTLCGSTAALKNHPTINAARAYVGSPKAAPAAPPPPPEDKPPAEEPEDMSKDVIKFLNAKTTDKKLAAQIRDQVGFDDFGSLRKAEPEKVLEFFRLYEGAVRKGTPQ
jgi:hypothetical protein